MTKTIAALFAVALAFAATAPAHAEIICDEDGCRPALVLSEPSLFGDDDDCGCEY